MGAMVKAIGRAAIGRAAIGAVLALLAGPALADWGNEQGIDTASAFVDAERGRRFALRCTRDAPGTFRLVLDMVAKPRLMQAPAPLGFTIAGRRYRYRGTMAELGDGLRRITTDTVRFDDPTQQRMRRDLRRGIRVSVEDQSSYRLHGFGLSGSDAAVETFERACDELWTTPRPDRAPTAENQPLAGGDVEVATVAEPTAGEPTAAERTPEPAAPDAFEPAQEGAWRLELADGNPVAFTEGLAGDRIGLACTADGGTDWMLDVVEGGERPSSMLNVEIAGPGTSVSVVAVRAPARERGLGSFRGRFERFEQRAILRDLGRGDGDISVVTSEGTTLAALPLDGAPAIVPRLLRACRKRTE